MAIHPVTGEVYITGFTASTAFPKVTGGEQPTKGSGTDAFVMRVTEDLLVRPQATYLGATGTDIATALAIHPASGEIYVAGYTSAANFPKTAGAEQTAPEPGSTGNDAFVSRYSLDLMAVDVVPDPFSFAPKVGVLPGSFQLSDGAHITGVTGSIPISLVGGGEFAEYCISSTAVCNCNVQALGKAPSTIDNNQYACVRQRAPAAVPASAKVTLIAGGGAASFIVGTGNDLGSLCTLDVDGNGQVTALTDGLLVIRAMFGLTGTTVTNNAIGPNATRSTWEQIRAHLNGNCGTNFAP
jgi:hypothetical protein